MGTEMKPNCSLLAITVFFFCLHTAVADILGLCNIVNCVMGTCVNTSLLAPSCQCNKGWSQPNISLPLPIPFLPCVIPNCTFNTSCSSAAPPSAPLLPLPAPANITPCAYSVCGEGGFCEQTSAFNYICKCNEGYENLLNMTSAPCVKECFLDADCSNLGIGLGGGGTPPATTAPQTPGNSKGVANVIPSAIIMGIVSICFLIIFI